MEDKVLDDNKVISDEGIVAGSMLTVDFTDFKIKLKYGSKVEEVTVDPDNLVESLKDTIKEKFGISQEDSYSIKKNGVAIETE
jgi:hypothetical protein